MPRLKRDHISPTDGEEAEIQRQISEDPEDAAHWETSSLPRPATEIAPHIVEGYRRTRGSQKSPTKEKITVRLDSDIVAHFRQSGRGWQTRLNEALRKSVADL